MQSHHSLSFLWQKVILISGLVLKKVTGLISPPPPFAQTPFPPAQLPTDFINHFHCSDPCVPPLPSLPSSHGQHGLFGFVTLQPLVQHLSLFSSLWSLYQHPSWDTSISQQMAWTLLLNLDSQIPRLLELEENQENINPTPTE